MSLTDFQDKQRFKLIGDLVLTEWVLKGVHLPKVTVYLDKGSGVAYQVCEQAGLYRSTEVPKTTEVLPYGEWQALSQ